MIPNAAAGWSPKTHRLAPACDREPGPGRWRPSRALGLPVRHRHVVGEPWPLEQEPSRPCREQRSARQPSTCVVGSIRRWCRVPGTRLPCAYDGCSFAPPRGDLTYRPLTMPAGCLAGVSGGFAFSWPLGRAEAVVVESRVLPWTARANLPRSRSCGSQARHSLLTVCIASNPCEVTATHLNVGCRGPGPGGRRRKLNHYLRVACI